MTTVTETARLIGELRRLHAARDRRRWLVAAILACRAVLAAGTVLGVALAAGGVGTPAGWVLVAAVVGYVAGDVLEGVDARRHPVGGCSET